MPKPEAYSETHKRNITLDEAHELYFSQIGKKTRFVFRCGDPICRCKLNPLVVGALYDRADKSGTKHYTPYFRVHESHPHLATCTWVENINRLKENTKRTTESTEGWAVSTKGLIFKLDSATGSTSRNGESRIKSHSTLERPETSKFMLTVGSRYLAYDSIQRGKIPLTIEKIVSGTFFSVCRPVNTFHHHYQSKHIYFGRVKVVELSNVFLIEFIKKITFDGSKTNLSLVGQIKLLKRDLDLKDLQLKSILTDISKRSIAAVCFFYSAEMPAVQSIQSKDIARFEIASLAHISIIPV